VANAHGGFLVSERGAGCTWVENSQFFRLTPWHNDPVSDPASEVVYLRDEDSGDCWTATPAPMRRDKPYTVVHGAGSSSFQHEAFGIATHLTLGITADAPIKLSLLRIANQATRARRIAGTTGVGVDPCAALRCVLDLAPGETRDIVIVLGAAQGEDAARDAVREYRDVPRAEAAIRQNVERWRARLSVISVQTPEPTFDV